MLRGLSLAVHDDCTTASAVLWCAVFHLGPVCVRHTYTQPRAHLTWKSAVRVAPQAPDVGGSAVRGQRRNTLRHERGKQQKLGNPVAVK